MVESRLAAVILAAGQGTRMNSDLAKVLHPLAGRPMIHRVVDGIRDIADPIVVVVGYQRERVCETLGLGFLYVVQERQAGTGHALAQAKPVLAGFCGDVIVINGDTPLLDSDDILNLVEDHRRQRSAATMLTTTLADPAGYGRIVRDGHGGVTVVEEKNAEPGQLAIAEVNSGVYCFSSPRIWDAVDQLKPDPVTGEQYIVELFRILSTVGERVWTVSGRDWERSMGINDHRALARAETILNERKLDQLLRNGVRIVDPSTTRVEPESVIAPGVVLQPFSIVRGASKIAPRAVIGPHALISDSEISEDATVLWSVLDRARVGPGCLVGPFSHLRPHAVLDEKAKVGNFTEIKNSHVGAGSKIPHHSYVGDTEIGQRVNVGAGTITVNYDGQAKHRTVIGNDAFIGCNTNLVAPVTVGEGAYIGAGSTITKSVPADALAVSRSAQSVFEEWAKKRRARRESEQRRD